MYYKISCNCLKYCNIKIIKKNIQVIIVKSDKALPTCNNRALYLHKLTSQKKVKYEKYKINKKKIKR